MALSDKETLRYDRQMLLGPIGPQGQQRLKDSRVLIAGIGGLGCPAALYLASAGVGHLTLVDYDDVETSNLHRQVLFRDSDVGAPKVLAAAAHLGRVNPYIDIATSAIRIDRTTAQQLVAGFDVVVDATDDPQARYALNDVCMTQDIPIVHGSVYGFEGRLAVFGTDDGGCLRCLWPEPPQKDLRCDCAQEGTLGAITGIIGSHQALETIKVITETSHLKNRLLVVDMLGSISRTIAFSRDPSCKACSVRNMSKRTDIRRPALEIAPEKLDILLGSGTLPLLIDVREQAGPQKDSPFTIKHFPLSELTRRSADLDKTTRMITVCDTGIKSRRAARILQELGFKAQSLQGGLDTYLATSLHKSK